LRRGNLDDGYPVQDGFFYDDLEIGQVFPSARSIRIERDRLIAFAEEFDPQPAHLSDDLAAKSQFGELIASGWHTGSVSLRLTTETMKIAGGGMGAGIEKMNWLRPVRPGDELRIEITVQSKRLSRTRPERGLVTFYTATLNQHGEKVMEMTSHVFLPRRPAMVEGGS